MKSIFPVFGNDIAFLTEVWGEKENKKNQFNLKGVPEIMQNSEII